MKLSKLASVIGLSFTLLENVVAYVENLTPCEGFYFMRDSGEVGIAKYDPGSNKLSTVISKYIEGAERKDAEGEAVTTPTAIIAGKPDGTEVAAVIVTISNEFKLIFKSLYTGDGASSTEITSSYSLSTSDREYLNRGLPGGVFEYSGNGKYFAMSESGVTTVYSRSGSGVSLPETYSGRARFRSVSGKDYSNHATQITRVSGSTFEVQDFELGTVLESISFPESDPSWTTVHDITFSPDGYLAAVIVSNGVNMDLKIIGLNSSPPNLGSEVADPNGSIRWNKVVPVTTDGFPTAVFSKDGVFFTDGSTVWKLALVDGTELWSDTELSDIDLDYGVNQLALMDDDKRVLVSVNTNTHYILSASTGETIILYEVSSFVIGSQSSPLATFTPTISGKYFFARVEQTEEELDWIFDPFTDDFVKDNHVIYATVGVYSSTLDTLEFADSLLTHSEIGSTGSRDTSPFTFAKLQAVGVCPPSTGTLGDITIIEYVVSFAVLGGLILSCCVCAYCKTRSTTTAESFKKLPVAVAEDGTDNPTIKVDAISPGDGDQKTVPYVNPTTIKPRIVVAAAQLPVDEQEEEEFIPVLQAESSVAQLETDAVIVGVNEEGTEEHA